MVNRLSTSQSTSISRVLQFNALFALLYHSVDLVTNNALHGFLPLVPVELDMTLVKMSDRHAHGRSASYSAAALHVVIVILRKRTWAAIEDHPKNLRVRPLLSPSKLNHGLVYKKTTFGRDCCKNIA